MSTGSDESPYLAICSCLFFFFIVADTLSMATINQTGTQTYSSFSEQLSLQLEKMELNIYSLTEKVISLASIEIIMSHGLNILSSRTDSHHD